MVALGLLFNVEIAAAIRTWMNSTAYNHCFLVIPIAAYLAWDRRNDLQGLAVVPMPVVALAGIPLALTWLLAERLGIMEGRQLVAITFVELLLAAVLGWRLWWGLAGPLLYLYFLVPFGAFLTPKLQDFTTVFVRHGLDVLNIPAYIDGYTIEIPEGTFYIAEACAGLRFLIASIAFGCLYALLMYRSPGPPRGLHCRVDCRADHCQWLPCGGHCRTRDMCLAAPRRRRPITSLYGWIFFSLVILMLIGLGLPFREDIERGDTPPRLDRIAGKRKTASGARGLAGVFVVVLAAISPRWRCSSIVLARRPWHPSRRWLWPGLCGLAGRYACAVGPAGSLVMRRVACNGLVLNVRVDVFGTQPPPPRCWQRRANSSTLPNPANEEEVASETEWLPMSSGPQRFWRLTRKYTAGCSDRCRGPGLMVQPATGGLKTRERLAWSSLTAAWMAPVVVVVSARRWTTCGDDGVRARHRAANGCVSGAVTNTAQIERIAASRD